LPKWAAKKTVSAAARQLYKKKGSVSMAAQVFTRHDLEAKIVRRSWEDEGFRMELTSNPSSAFAKYLNVPAANLPRISVHKEERGSWHMVLPAKPGNPSALSEQELEKVAGGVTPAVSLVVTLVTYAAASDAVAELTGDFTDGRPAFEVSDPW
jgi:hypothetical protein